MQKYYKDFDIVIIGAGLSGLILANEIIKKNKKKILIIEKNKNLTVNKNWCFWNKPLNDFTENFDHEWKKISIAINKKEKILTEPGLKYLHIHSSKFFNVMKKRLEEKKVKILFNTKINTIKFKDDKYFLKIKKQFISSDYIFDSRPTNNKIEKSEKLFQHFYGYEVSFKKPVLDKDKVILMDFQNFKNGVEFMYVLPFTANKALFESTYFSKRFLHEKNYRKNVVNYLKKNFKNCEYSIKYKENGLIPMFYNKFDNCNNFFKIGLYGNWIRSSTGYALQDSFENARNIAENFKSQKKIIIPKKTILTFLDDIFCFFILNQSKNSKKFFESFFFNNSLSNIVAFLTGKINFFQLIKILISLPKKMLFLSMIGFLKFKYLKK
jgi:lycopene beta-cyclase